MIYPVVEKEQAPIFFVYCLKMWKIGIRFFAKEFMFENYVFAVEKFNWYNSRDEGDSFSGRSWFLIRISDLRWSHAIGTVYFEH